MNNILLMKEKLKNFFLWVTNEEGVKIKLKKVLIIFFCFLSFQAFSAEDEAAATGTQAAAAKGVQAATEAASGCLTPECLGTGDNLGSPNVEMAELCRSTLPAHCQKIQDIKLTTCYDDQTNWAGVTGSGGIACALGLWQGAVDVGVGTWNIFKGIFNFAVDSEYREEALNTMSHLSEQFSDSEKVKAFLTDPLLENMDEWVQCLNYKGRWEYVCESGIQLIGSVWVGFHVLDKGIALPVQKLRHLIGGRSAPKLTMAQKYDQRKSLQEKLASGEVDISTLSPYQLSRLKPKDMSKMNVSGLTDDMADHLSKRQLGAVPLSNIKQMSIDKNSRTLSRLSDDQFQAVMGSGQDISQIPFEIIEGNIKRIRAEDIGKLDQLDQISPKAFAQLSADQIRGMSHRQVSHITPDHEVQLSERLKGALAETRQKRQREEDAKTPEEKQQEQAERQRVQEERQRTQERQQRQAEQQQQAKQIKLQEEQIKQDQQKQLSRIRKYAEQNISIINLRIAQLESRAKQLKSPAYTGMKVREIELPRVETEMAQMRRRLALRQNLQKWRSDLVVKTKQTQQLDDLNISRQQKEIRRRQLNDEIYDLNRRIRIHINSDRKIREWEDDLIKKMRKQARKMRKKAAIHGNNSNRAKIQQQRLDREIEELNRRIRTESVLTE